MAVKSEHRLDDHFLGKAETVKKTYDRIVQSMKKIGPVSEEVKKTSIHLVRKSAFAGVATRRDALILTVKSPTDLKSPRIIKHEQASAHRWHLEVRLNVPADVDREVLGWLKDSYEMSG